jgi:hypothetical protein
MIRAGCSIDFEDEDDPTETHCGFTATCNQTGRKFSIEAKRRTEGNPHLDVGKQLISSLRKKANHGRLVFIEVNVDRTAVRYRNEQPLLVSSERANGPLVRCSWLQNSGSKEILK